MAYKWANVNTVTRWREVRANTNEQKDETEQHDHLKCAQTGRAA